MISASVIENRNPLLNTFLGKPNPLQLNPVLMLHGIFNAPGDIILTEGFIIASCSSPITQNNVLTVRVSTSNQVERINKPEFFFELFKRSCSG